MQDVNFLTAFLPVAAAVALGWFLNEFTHLRRARSAFRAASGRALAELLEIHHYMRAVEVIFSEIKSRLPIPPKVVLQSMVWLGQLLPPDRSLPARYSAAVTELAASHPLLSFRLRSKEQIPAFLASLRALALGEQEDSDVATTVERIVTSSAFSALEESIREIAWSHGIRTWWSIRAWLRKKMELPGDYRRLLDENLEKLRKAGAPSYGA